METPRSGSTAASPAPRAGRGADREARARALLDAVRAGDLDVVRDALDADPALVHERDEGGDSLVVAAAYRGHRAVAELLAARARAAGGLDAWEAALTGDVPRLRALLDDDPSLVGARRHDGWTLLHFAAIHGRVDVADLLLDRGADVALLSTNGIANTALHATLAMSGAQPLVERLVARGADVNARGGGGYRPLHLAASRGNLAAIELLLDHGADADARADDGRTAADLAVERGHAAAAARLGAG